MKPEAARREFDIDFFRGFVCLCLAVLHFFNSSLYEPLERLIGSVGKYCILHVRLGVESFFILAGFMMAHMLRPVPGEDISIGGYLKRRFLRLIVPYWIAVLLFVAFRWTVRLLFGAESAPTFVDVVSQLFLVQEFFIGLDRLEKVTPVGYWSMVTLEQFYLIWLALYGCCLLLLGKNRTGSYGRAEKTMAFLTFAACLGSLALCVWSEGLLPGTSLSWHVVDGHYFTFSIGRNDFAVQLPVCAVFLTLGMLLYWAIRQRVFRNYFILAAVALLIAVSGTFYSKLVKAVITTVLFIVLARGARVPNNMVVRFLAFCGQRAYSIYLMHAIAGIGLIAVTWRLTKKGDWIALPILFAALAVSILAAMVFYKYVELPFQKRSRAVFYRKKALTPSVAIEDKDIGRPSPIGEDIVHLNHAVEAAK